MSFKKRSMSLNVKKKKIKPNNILNLNIHTSKNSPICSVNISPQYFSSKFKNNFSNTTTNNSGSNTSSSNY